MPAAAVEGVSPATSGVPPQGGRRRRRIRGERHFPAQSRAGLAPALFGLSLKPFRT